MTSIDGKMRGLLTGRGGAWCLLCNITREQAAGIHEKDIDLLYNFEWGISYSYKQAQKIWDSYKIKDSCGVEAIQKRIGDYNL